MARHRMDVLGCSVRLAVDVVVRVAVLRSRRARAYVEAVRLHQPRQLRRVRRMALRARELVHGRLHIS